MQYLTGASVPSIEPPDCLAFSHFGSNLWVQTRDDCVERYDLYRGGEPNFSLSLSRHSFIMLKANEVGIDILARSSSKSDTIIVVRQNGMHTFSSHGYKVSDFRRTEGGELVVLEDPPCNLKRLNDRLEVVENYHCAGSNHILLDGYFVWTENRYLVLQGYNESSRQLWDQEWCPLDGATQLTAGQGNTFVMINHLKWVVLDAVGRRLIRNGTFEVPFIHSIKLTHSYMVVTGEGVSWVDLNNNEQNALQAIGREVPISDVMVENEILLIEYERVVDIWDLSVAPFRKLKQIEGLTISNASISNRRFVYYLNDIIYINDL